MSHYEPHLRNKGRIRCRRADGCEDVTEDEGKAENCDVDWVSYAGNVIR